LAGIKRIERVVMKAMEYVLALDLDNVLACEADEDSKEGTKIFGIHRELPGIIGTINAHRAILTHRSRQEAVGILSALGIDHGMITETFAAEDLLRSAVLNGNLWRLFRDGLKKSYILPVICRRYKVPPCRIAFVDDRIENVHDMLQAGVGLGLVAPWRQIAKNTFRSFEFESLVATVNDWINCNSVERQEASLKFLEASTQEFVAFGGKAAFDGTFGSSVFNFCRRAVKAGRGILNGSRGNVSIYR
jgi:hypothetical protein